jgi:hypothetical protein
MRIKILMLPVVVAGLALSSGCTGSPEQVGGQAAPAGAATPAASVTPSSARASSAAPSAVASVTPSRTSSSPKSPVLVLGPTSFGKLKIGMTAKAATATGEVDAPATDRCGAAPLKSARSADVTVIYSSDKGLVAIPAYGRIATPQGARIGSTLQQVQKFHRDFAARDVDGDWVDSGTGYAGWNDAYPGVHYRFDFQDGKVAGMSLEHDQQNCYE